MMLMIHHYSYCNTFALILATCQHIHGPNCHARALHRVQGISIPAAYMGTNCIPMEVILEVRGWQICSPMVRLSYMVEAVSSVVVKLLLT